MLWVTVALRMTHQLGERATLIGNAQVAALVRQSQGHTAVLACELGAWLTHPVQYIENIMVRSTAT